MIELQEFAHIVEFSYQSKTEQFVVRFLNNNSYTLKTSDLPKKLQTRKPKWEEAIKSPDGSSILVQAGEDWRQIPFHIIHSRGKQI